MDNEKILRPCSGGRKKHSDAEAQMGLRILISSSGLSSSDEIMK